MRMRALTLVQPWAWAVTQGKTVENRTRPMSYRGRLAIHAGLRINREDYRAPGVAAALTAFTERHGRPPTMVTGAVIAVADVVGCHGDSRCCLPWGQAFQHHIELDNVQQLRSPVPARGQLGLWSLSEDDTAAVLGQVAR